MKEDLKKKRGQLLESVFLALEKKLRALGKEFDDLQKRAEDNNAIKKDDERAF